MEESDETERQSCGNYRFNGVIGRAIVWAGCQGNYFFPKKIRG